MSLTWILEREMFADNHDRLHDAIVAEGMSVINWSDEWLTNGRFPKVEGDVLFHGSLGAAAYIREKKLWMPGAFCSVENFACTAWYDLAKEWLFQQNWHLSTVRAFVENPHPIIESIGSDTFFVRPNSPLKPFSGRVLSLDNLSMAALDYGFYYDNPNEEIVVCSIQKVLDEWRYIVCDKKVIAGSAYLADGRVAQDTEWKGEPFALAQKIADSLPSPDEVYVLDICLSKDGYKLLELNPFSGADLYNCNRLDIVTGIAEFIA